MDHIPLMEGEEKLEVLNLSNNKIIMMENLVSIHNLVYLDLQKN
jgi:Leucine-rich repeat (LRR) protein